MSDVLADRDLYLNYTYNREHKIYSNFPVFYVTIGIISVIGGLIFLLNIVCCWCSRHRQYWRDRHTGNRWIHSLWVVTPHKNPPLDLTELKPRIVHTVYPPQETYYPESVPGDVEAHYDSRLGTPQPQEYMELHKRESEI